MAKISKQRQKECIDHLKEILSPGDTVFTNLKHVSRSGMYRVINLMVIKNNEPRNIDHLAADLLEGYDSRHYGCKASGCGMDMGFALVYDLSHQLFKDGFTCIGEKCPSNDHSNGDRNYKPHHHESGGYCLRHKWL